MITSKDIEYVIVQAGGKGTRMGHYTVNKPKCLVPVNDVPMIVNLLQVYKGKKVIIIGDYLLDVLESYLKTFCFQYDYKIISTNESGTSAGLKEAVKNIPDDKPFIVTWSDLFFLKEQEFSFNTDLLVGLSNTFKCRWKLESNKFINESSNSCGVSGFFAFKDKSRFLNITADKSLVRGFLTDFYSEDDISSFYNHDCFEVGELENYENLLSQRLTHRFFNKVETKENKIYKTCVDSKYQDVHQKEKQWYQFVKGKVDCIPSIYSTDPLIMEKINGKHLWQVEDNKLEIINNYCDTLDSLHKIDSFTTDKNDCMSVYFAKSYQRVLEVKNLIKFLNEPSIKINGVNCLNPIYNIKDFEDTISFISNIDEYKVIHGDCTFSNTLVDSNSKIWLIDPRGIFGSTEIYGDPRYDWTKFYYSASGNYDSINSKKFKVSIVGNDVELQIKSNGYEDYSDLIIERSGMSKKEIELIHSSIWLSLTGYVKEDIDSFLYAFYNGCYLWSKHCG